MRHGYDLFGWYIGLVPDSERRSTALPPANGSTDRIPGNQMSNWDGRNWVERPFATPRDVEEESRLESARSEALARLEGELRDKFERKFDESAAAVISCLPIFLDLWRSINNDSRSANSGWQWVLDHRAVYAQAKTAIKAAESRRQLREIFPINWP